VWVFHILRGISYSLGWWEPFYRVGAFASTEQAYFLIEEICFFTRSWKQRDKPHERHIFMQGLYESIVTAGGAPPDRLNKN